MAFPQWPPKDPDEVLDYNIDWSPRLTSPDVISASEWIVPDGLVVENEIMTDNSTTIWLSSGTTGEAYDVLNRVDTMEGRTMDQTVTLKIKTK
jgi:hypothetical protein